MNDVTKAYWSREVIKHLDIKESTLRKWCILLEKKGYIFIRNDQNQRAFFEHDLLALRMLADMSSSPGITLDMAADAVVIKYARADDTIITPPVTDMTVPVMDTNRELLEQIMAKVDRQDQFNKELLDKLDQQQEYIEKSITRRDEQLLAAIREMQETKKQLAAAKEEKPWWMFWA